jgi:hypothetical protein
MNFLLLLFLLIDFEGQRAKRHGARVGVLIEWILLLGRNCDWALGHWAWEVDQDDDDYMPQIPGNSAWDTSRGRSDTAASSEQRV